MTISLLGWVATAVFATSYFSRKAETLTRIQAVAACLWILYGIAIGAVPAIVANAIVAGAALYSSFRANRTENSREGQVNKGLAGEKKIPLLKEGEPEVG
jgi:hypothetical protein